MDYNVLSEHIVAWIKKTVHSAGFIDVIIGMSGGIDSSLSAVLAVAALGSNHVFPVLMPYGNLHGHSVTDAREMIDFLKIPETNVSLIDIKQSVDVLWENTKGFGQRENVIPAQAGIHGSPNGSGMTRKKILDNVQLGNMMARVRMIYLFDKAKEFSALVCGTENKTEHYLGYFTRFGDSASDLEPIVSLYKTDVWEMAKTLHIPEKIITKAPTAGLWEEQTDEGELGFTYKEADNVLQYYIDEHLSVDAIVQKGLTKEVVEKVLARVKQNEFKHKLPYEFTR